MKLLLAAEYSDTASSLEVGMEYIYFENEKVFSLISIYKFYFNSIGARPR